MNSVYRIVTKAIISKRQGNATLDELLMYLKMSNEILQENSSGYHRYYELEELVSELVKNQVIETK